MRVRELECLNDQGTDTCKGDVELRDSLSPTGVWHPRCEHHYEERLVEQDRINALYGGIAPPADFDPTYAGEVW